MPRADWRIIAVLLCATVLVYTPALRAPFIWDDIEGIANNATIRTLTPLSVPLSPPPRTALSGRPVVNLSLAVNYAINKSLGIDQRPDPDGPDKSAGYHLFNVLIHLLNGVLLLAIARRALRENVLGETWAVAADPIAYSVCALWLLHPVQTDALNYLVQRTELIASACYLGVLYASIRAWDAATDNKRLMWYAVGAFACITGMFSKEIAISAPIAVLLYDRAFKTSSWRALLKPGNGRGWYYALLGATMLIVLATVTTGQRNASIGFGFGTSWYQYLYTQAWAISHYLRLAIWPSGLTLDYGMDPVRDGRGIFGLVLLGSVAIATVAAWTRRKRWMPAGVASACFFMILAPSSSVVPIATEIAAERRFYLPFAATLILVTAAIELARRRYAPSITPVRVALALMTCAAVFGLVTFTRSKEYNEPELLWRESIANVPGNARAYDNLAFLLATRHHDRIAEADSLWQRAMAVDSTYMPAWINLAGIRALGGKTSDAVELLTHVLDRQPDNAMAELHLGIIYTANGNVNLAIPHLKHAAELAPDEEAFLQLGSAYMTVRKPDSAIAPLRAALAINPERLSALGLLGSAFTESGNPAAAEAPLRDLAARLPNSGLALSALSLNQAQLGQNTEAAETAKRAVANANGDPTVFRYAGRTLLQLNNPSAAIECFSEAVRLDSADADAYAWLGVAEARVGNRAGAQRALHQALLLDPDNQIALRGEAPPKTKARSPQ